MAQNESSYFGHLVFFKVSPDNKVLKGQKYEIMAYDESSTSGKFLEEGQYGQYYMRDDNYDYGNNSFSFDILPQYFKDFVNNTNTFEQYKAFADSNNKYLQTFTSSMHGNIPAAAMRFYIPVKLKEVKGTPGYKKKDLAIIFNVDYELYYDRETHEPLYKYVRAEAWGHWYVNLNDYKNVKTVEDLLAISANYIVDGDNLSCINTNNDMIIMDSDECTYTDSYGSGAYTLVPYFVEEKGSVKFEIDNTVNGLAKYNASKDKKLEYKVTIKNVGDAVSSNNILKTYVPEEVEVIESEISDNGIYNKSEHFITWNLELMDPGEVLAVTYEATAPNETNGKDLIGNSSVASDQVANAVYSNNTVVTMDKIVEVIHNPETGTMVYIANTNIGLPLTHLVLFLAVLAMVIVLLTKKLLKMKH